MARSGASQPASWHRFGWQWHSQRRCGKLEENKFSDRCYDLETKQWLAHVEILTSCGMVPGECSYLDECPVCDGDTLTVILVPADDLAGLEAESETAPDA